MAVTSRRVYQVHRDRQREGIIDAAEMLFLEHGIESVNMADIASVAQVTRATLYKYFPSKEEVAWTVFERYCECIVESARLFDTRHLNGAQRVEHIMRSWQQTFFESPQMALYFAQFDVLYSRQGSAERMNSFKWHLHNGEEPIVTALRDGIADGSVRCDIDVELTGVTIHSLMMGLNRRLAVAQPTFVAEFGQTLPAVYDTAITTIMQGICTSTTTR